MSLVWIIAEQHQGSIRPTSFELLARGRPLAKELGTGIAAILIGHGLDNEEMQRLIRHGADEVLSLQRAELEEFNCETHSNILCNLIADRKPSIILASATTTGRTLMPHVAVKTHAGLTADCTELAIEPGTDNLLQTRPAIGGNIMATIRTPAHRPQMATIRPNSTKVLGADSTRMGRIIEIPVSDDCLDFRSRVTGYRKWDHIGKNLEESDVVVAGGRGLRKTENFRLIEGLSERLDGAVGATRDAVDKGWIGYPHQIGLSGKTISPRLYIGAGISGSIQHLAGMKTSETIISVNSDPDANIHNVADLAVIGDLFDVLPELIRQLGGSVPSVSRGDSVPTRASNLGKEKQRDQKSSSPYAAVTPAVVERLKEIVGEKNVDLGADTLETYSHDETYAAEYGHMPEVVVFPRSSEEIGKILKLANVKNIPVTPRGAGSGLSGGSIPLFGGILLSVEKMNRLLELDVDNMVAEVEAGMVTNEFAQKVKDEGLFFAGYPMSLETCVVGGNIAENAGGGKAVKYGVTGRYIMGLEIVTPTGDIVRLGGKASKDVSGYDLKQLIVGSEGTLGIVSKATIRLLGLPSHSADLLVLFDTPKSAIDVVPRILKSGITPAALEFMDRLSVQTTCRYLNESLPYGDAGAMLLIEVDGSNREQVENDLLNIGDLCKEVGAQEVYAAENRNAIERIWNVRKNIAEAFKVFSPIQSLEDIVVPTARIPDLIPELERIAQTFQMQIPCYGHAGDGNLHATLVKDPNMNQVTWKKNEEEALREIYRITTKLGGKISGEHGIGSKRKGYLKEFIDPVELELMKGIKRAWDPKSILNPGKIFDIS